MKDFRKLTVWRQAHQLVLEVYKVTKGFPTQEQYGLTSQLRRAAMSIPSNIAEGCGRHGDAEFCRYLQIAMGSSSEVEYQLLLAKDLGLISSGSYRELNEAVCGVKRMLAAFIDRLRKNQKS